MLSRLVLQRVSSRAFVPNVASTACLRSVVVARQHLARTFLTTAHVSEPVAKDSESTKAKSKAKATTTKKAATKKTATTKKAAGKTKATAKKSSKAKPKKEVSIDPEDRFKTPLKSLKLTKEEKPPHKAATAYSLFVREQYVATPKVNNRDEFMARSKEIAAQWNQLSDEAKKPYFDKEKELRAEFHAKLVAWFEKTDPRIILAYNKQRKAANKQKVYAPADTSRPSKPLPSFIQFTRDIGDQVEYRSDLPHKEALSVHARTIAEKWKALPAQEQERYKTQYRDAMEAYKQEHATA